MNILQLFGFAACFIIIRLARRRPGDTTKNTATMRCFNYSGRGESKYMRTSRFFGEVRINIEDTHSHKVASDLIRKS